MAIRVQITIQDDGFLDAIAFASAPNGGLVVPPDATSVTHRDLIVALATRYRLPAVYSVRPFVTAGGLMSYGVDFADMFRQAASMLTASCAATSPPACRCKRRPNLKRWLISKRQRRAA
jgi:hypothetical protein